MVCAVLRHSYSCTLHYKNNTDHIRLLWEWKSFRQLLSTALVCWQQCVKTASMWCITFISFYNLKISNAILNGENHFALVFFPSILATPFSQWGAVNVHYTDWLAVIQLYARHTITLCRYSDISFILSAWFVILDAFLLV